MLITDVKGGQGAVKNSKQQHRHPYKLAPKTLERLRQEPRANFALYLTTTVNYPQSKELSRQWCASETEAARAARGNQEIKDPSILCNDTD